MPTKTPKPKPKRSETYVCVESFAGNDVMVSAGTRLRGNHEIVKKYGHFFVREVSGEDIEGLIASRRVELARAFPETREELSGKEFFGGQTFDLDAKHAEAVLKEIGAWLEVVEPIEAAHNLAAVEEG